jgi:hypothetical protein
MCFSLINRYFDDKKMHIALVIAIGVFAADSFIFTTYRHNIYKVSTITFKLPSMNDIFTGKIKPHDHYSFRRSWEQSRKKKQYVKHLWRSSRGREPVYGDRGSELDESNFIFLDVVKGMLTSEVLSVATNGPNLILQPTQLEFHDLNGDKKADAVCYDTTIRDRGFIRTGLNNGAGFNKFNLSRWYWVEGLSRLDGSGKNAEKRMKYGDVNGDGRIDMLYFETWRSFVVSISFSGDNAQFSQPVNCLKYPASDPEQLQMADVNGDGKADAVFFNTRTDNCVLINIAGERGFQKPQVWIRYHVSDPEQFKCADVDGDGKADALYYNRYGVQGIMVSLSTGTAFSKPALWAGWENLEYERIKYADVNGDNRADALYYHKTKDSGIVKVRLSKGDSFGEEQKWLEFDDYVPQCMQYADINGDGKADALCVNPFSFRIEKFISSGLAFVPFSE